MNLISKLSLILLFTACLSQLNGQFYFQPGYIITNQNDTLKGLVDYRGAERNARICVFKENKSSDAKEYKPFDIRGYGFPGTRFYVSKNIKSNGQEIPLFAKFLVEGATDSYFYAKDARIYYLIEK